MLLGAWQASAACLVHLPCEQGWVLRRAVLVLGRYQGFTFLGLLNTWIPLPVRWFSGVTSRWWGQASSMLGVGTHPWLCACMSKMSVIEGAPC